ncbi:MAG: hypothetical protein ACOC0H_05930 [Thermodesulfobacteriota bacterium]
MPHTAKKLENWKSKAILRANEIRYLRRENIRLKNARDKYKAEANEAGKKFKEQDAAAKCPLWRVNSTLFSLPFNFSVSPALDSEPFPGPLAFLGAISNKRRTVMRKEYAETAARGWGLLHLFVRLSTVIQGVFLAFSLA